MCLFVFSSVKKAIFELQMRFFVCLFVFLVCLFVFVLLLLVCFGLFLFCFVFDRRTTSHRSRVRPRRDWWTDTLGLYRLSWMDRTIFTVIVTRFAGYNVEHVGLLSVSFCFQRISTIAMQISNTEFVHGRPHTSSCLPGKNYRNRYTIIQCALPGRSPSYCVLKLGVAEIIEEPYL